MLAVSGIHTKHIHRISLKALGWDELVSSVVIFLVSQGPWLLFWRTSSFSSLQVSLVRLVFQWTDLGILSIELPECITFFCVLCTLEIFVTNLVACLTQLLIRAVFQLILLIVHSVIEIQSNLLQALLILLLVLGLKGRSWACVVRECPIDGWINVSRKKEKIT